MVTFFIPLTISKSVHIKLDWLYLYCLEKDAFEESFYNTKDSIKNKIYTINHKEQKKSFLNFLCKLAQQARL